MPKKPTKPNHIYLIYMYKENLSNNLQELICHKTKPDPLLPSVLGQIDQWRVLMAQVLDCGL